MSEHLLTLPEGLPVPVDDGACDHLPGLALPSLVLESSAGPVDVAGLDVLFLPFPVLADPGLRLADALALPTFEAGDDTLYGRVTLVAGRGRIDKVFYPVLPPDRNAADVVEWLEARE